jgi:hypothetical protein
MNETISSTTNQQSSDDKKRRSWIGNRRLFLGLAAIGVGVLGYATYLTYNNAKRFSSHLLTSSLTSSSATSLTASSLTSTSSLTSSSLTSTSKQLVSLEGELYVGWDGNGIKEEGMQPLSNEIMVLDSVSKRLSGGIVPDFVAKSTSDSSGHWEIDDIPTGDYLLHSNTPDVFSGRNNFQFRYMCQSNNDFRPVNGTVLIGGSYGGQGTVDSYELSLDESQKTNFEFSNGFLTLPFLKGTPIKINAYVDESNGNCENYLGKSCGGAPGYPGTDFAMPVGTPVVAAAPGKVESISGDSSKGISVVISHEDFTAFEALSTHYNLLSEVEVSEGQQVYRGQRLGLSGEDKTHPGPHLDFQLNRTSSAGSESEAPLGILDPFASTWNSRYGLGYWTKKNDPQFSV